MTGKEILFTEKVRHPSEDNSWINMREFYIDNDSTTKIKDEPIATNVTNSSSITVTAGDNIIWKNDSNGIQDFGFPTTTLQAIDENYNDNPLKDIKGVAVPTYVDSFTYTYLGIEKDISASVNVFNETTVSPTYKNFNYRLVNSSTNNPLKILPNKENLSISDRISAGDIILSRNSSQAIIGNQFEERISTAVSYWTGATVSQTTISNHIIEVCDFSFSNFTEAFNNITQTTWKAYSLQSSNRKIEVPAQGVSKIDIVGDVASTNDLTLTSKDFFIANNRSLIENFTATVLKDNIYVK